MPRSFQFVLRTGMFRVSKAGPCRVLWQTRHERHDGEYIMLFRLSHCWREDLIRDAEHSFAEHGDAFDW